ncbi:hypothetical protein [Ottowia sp.]|uniref:hypothetical protein n=1 Tax=Ottowia sp. TaxID=1898956 RepID=UPI0025F8C52A|nr:hypothetical protein [Ottowia sp.]MBK6616270.1 hypothetical protein [Ottowia sp.]
MPKWNKDQQKVYDACLTLWADKKSELYTADGRQRGGANVRCAFWDGYNGIDVKHRIPTGTMLQAAYHAGKECRRKAGGRPPMPTDDKPKVRTVRLNDARWAKYKLLGRTWLEVAIDTAVVPAARVARVAGAASAKAA